MNGTVPPPPPGAEAPKKKGLSPLAWFAIGCGALIVLGLGSCFVMTAIVANKAKNFVSDLEKNPDAAVIKAAELALQAQSGARGRELRMPKAGTITVREKATGKEVTFDLEDIKAGKLTDPVGRRGDRRRRRRRRAGRLDDRHLGQGHDGDRRRRRRPGARLGAGLSGRTRRLLLERAGRAARAAAPSPSTPRTRPTTVLAYYEDKAEGGRLRGGEDDARDHRRDGRQPRRALRQPHVQRDGGDPGRRRRRV